MISKQNHISMKKLFKIYKKGTTDNWVTILIPIEEFTLDILKFKMEKYLALGYEVKLINYNQID